MSPARPRPWAPCQLRKLPFPRFPTRWQISSHVHTRRRIPALSRHGRPRHAAGGHRQRGAQRGGSRPALQPAATAGSPPPPRRLPARRSRGQSLWRCQQAPPRLRNTLCKKEGGFEHCPSRVTVSIGVCKQRPKVKAGPPPVIVNKVLLTNSRAHSFNHHPRLPLWGKGRAGSYRDHVVHTA